MEADVQELKLKVRRSFGRVYSALKARESQTLRQIDVVGRGLGPEGRDRLSQIEISFENERAVFDEIGKFGVVDFGNLSMDEEAFAAEDYNDDDQSYSYKCLEEDAASLVEREAFGPVTDGDRRACHVKVSPEEVPRKLGERTVAVEASSPTTTEEDDSESFTVVNDETLSDEDEAKTTPEKDKPDPTRDWLNQIINETETEPSQIIDLMEHSAIECS